MGHTILKVFVSRRHAWTTPIESYDADGNTTATGGKSFAYDSEDHLKSMNGGAVTITYDGDGNRVQTIANGVVTRYLVDDLNPTGYAQVVEETGSVPRTYTYGLQRIDENQVINGVQTPSFYGYDGMGSVRQLTNSSGAVTDTYEYDAFGNKIASTGTTPNNYLYRSEQYDADLGLYYLRARYYNPVTGRFMSRDPNAGQIAVPATLHRYFYASDDPVDRFDPSGRGDLIEYRLTMICGGSLSCPVISGKAVVIGAIIVGQLAELLRYALTGEPPTPHAPEREPGPDGPGPDPAPVTGPPVAGAP